MADQGLKHLDVKDLETLKLDVDYERLFQSFNEQVKRFPEAVLRLEEMKRHNCGTWKTLEQEVRNLVSEANKISDKFEEVEAHKQLGNAKLRAAICDFKFGKPNKMIQDFKNKMADLVEQSQPVGKLPPEKFHAYGGVRNSKQIQEEQMKAGQTSTPSVSTAGIDLNFLKQLANDIRQEFQSFNEQVKLLDEAVLLLDEMKRYYCGRWEDLEKKIEELGREANKIGDMFLKLETVLLLDEKKRYYCRTWEDLGKEIEKLVAEANKIRDMFEELETPKEWNNVGLKRIKIDLFDPLQREIQYFLKEIIRSGIETTVHKGTDEVSKAKRDAKFILYVSDRLADELKTFRNVQKEEKAFALSDDDMIGPEFRTFNVQFRWFNEMKEHFDTMERHNGDEKTWEALVGEIRIRKLELEVGKLRDIFEEMEQITQKKASFVRRMISKFDLIVPIKGPFIGPLRQQIQDIVNANVNLRFLKRLADELGKLRIVDEEEKASALSDDDMIGREFRTFNLQVRWLDASLDHLDHLDEMKRHNSNEKTWEALEREIKKLELEAREVHHMFEKLEQITQKEASVVRRMIPKFNVIGQLRQKNLSFSKRLADELAKLRIVDEEEKASALSDDDMIGRESRIFNLQVRWLDASLDHLDHLDEMKRHNSNEKTWEALEREIKKLELEAGEVRDMFEKLEQTQKEASFVGRMIPKFNVIDTLRQKNLSFSKRLADELAKLRIVDEEETASALSDDDIIGREFQTFNLQDRWLDASLDHLDHLDEIKKLKLEALEVSHMFEKLEQTEKKASFVGRMIPKFDLVGPLRKRIQDIEEKINKSPIKRIEDGIEIFVEGQTSAQARRFEDEKDVVELLKEEVEPSHQGFHFVSITGPGGVGKSTLARQIYQRSDVREHFNYCGWVDMSKANTWRDVLCRIMEQIMGREEGKNTSKEEDLEFVIWNFVKWKKSLFILDNLRKKEDLDNLKRPFALSSSDAQAPKLSEPAALPVGPLPRSLGLQKSCCFSSQRLFPLTVLLTTSKEDVAQCADPEAPPHKLQPLDIEQSMKLFWKVVFQSSRDTEAGPSKVMEYLAKKILAYSYGLPLAIVELGRDLSAEPTVAAFKEVLENVRRRMERSTYELVDELLTQIYRDLPNNLKPVFLYFGLFPEDSDIQRDRLFRLWVAEGYSTMEENCGDCCKELMDRNLIQVAKWKSNGEPESFFISRFSHIFARSKGKSLDNITPQSFLKGNNYSGRVALHNNCNAHIMVEETSRRSWSSSSRPYSLLCFSKMSKLLSRCGDHKTLKVLDLENADLNNATLPRGIRRLINLKYLSLGGKHLTDLPTWVGKLSSLQTLSLCKSGIESLPIEILELKELRHLLCNSKSWTWISKDFIYKSAIGSRLRVSPRQHIHELKDLQTLWLHTGDWIRDGLEELTQLRELRVIGREGFMQRFEDALSQALLKLELLEVLHLEELGRGRRISLPSFQTHGKLYDITILGVIEKLPDLPQRLTRLRLGYISLTEETKTTLQELPELKDLTLDWHAHDGKEMNCSAGGFPTLECLTLNYFDPRMNYFDPSRVKCIPDGLKNFDPSRVNCIPGGLKNIKKLKELALFMPQEFLKKVKHGGKDWAKIEVIRINGSKEVENTQEKHGVPSSSIRSD